MAEARHCNVASMISMNYLEEDGPIAVNMLFHDDKGEMFILSTDRQTAGAIAARIAEMAAELRALGQQPLTVPAAPERIESFNAAGDQENEVVLLGLRGSRTGQLFGAMSKTDAERLASLLIAASASADRPKAN